MAYSEAVVVRVQTYKGEVERELADELVIGRDPGRRGVVLDPEDRWLSRKGLRIVKIGDLVLVQNTSRVPVSILTLGAMQDLAPQEALQLASDARVVVHGKDRGWTIDIKGVPPPPPRPPQTNLPPLPKDVRGRLGGDQLLALVVLCLPLVDPHRWADESRAGRLLTADAMARQMARAGVVVTAKAVNKKLEVIKDKFRELDLVVDTSDDLARCAVRHGIVTADDVLAFYAQQKDNAG